MKVLRCSVIWCKASRPLGLRLELKQSCLNILDAFALIDGQSAFTLQRLHLVDDVAGVTSDQVL